MLNVQIATFTARFLHTGFHVSPTELLAVLNELIEEAREIGFDDPGGLRDVTYTILRSCTLDLESVIIDMIKYFAQIVYKQDKLNLQLGRIVHSNRWLTYSLLFTLRDLVALNGEVGRAAQEFEKAVNAQIGSQLTKRES